MANPKLFSEFRSSYGHFYLIEIWDDEYTGTSPDQFNVTGEGFQLNYSGQTDNVYSPIIGSSVSFGMYVQDSATNAFLTNLKQYQQDRYFGVNVISTHDTISECHVALTQHGFTDSQMQNTFCLIMEDGVDWRLDNGQG